jgi:hypothetical protein
MPIMTVLPLGTATATQPAPLGFGRELLQRIDVDDTRRVLAGAIAPSGTNTASCTAYDDAVESSVSTLVDGAVHLNHTDGFDGCWAESRVVDN